jgi:soluble lytic murein transglycosylase-like protein
VTLRASAATLVCALSGAALCAFAPLAQAGAQVEERLAPSVVAGLAKAISDFPPPAGYGRRADVRTWVDDMSRRIAARIPDEPTRRDLLTTVHYEATRAGLDPQLVLGVIHHESGFNKYAFSSAGARGYMQVMPFWVRQIGGTSSDHDLFALRTNLRYGCTILRHYLDIERGDLFRALGRYNGSVGRADYPNAVLAAMNRYVPAAPSGSTSLRLSQSAQ